MLSGYSEPISWNKLSLAPLWLRDKFLDLIQRETNHARAGKKAYIIAKMNSLCDIKIITALYEASEAGVQIDLIIRGICSLKVGIPGISENITVHSIIGNFLEHSRIFYFYNEGFEEVYMGSADWMPRNLDKRVEILFPLEDPRLKQEVIEILQIQLNDTVKTHIMDKDGCYEKVDKRGKAILNSQKYFSEKANSEVLPKNDVPKSRIFEPIKGIE
jgi:polyphosphate kinase